MAKQKKQKTLGTALSAVPSFFRYFAAIFYDLLLLIAIFFLAIAILLPFNAGEAIKSPFVFPYLYSIGFLFYGWFWTHGGQTLGLQAWKLRLISNSSASIGWQQALIRYLSASCLLGLGFLWRIWRKDRKTLHDLSSQSYIIRTDINTNVDD